MLRILAILLSLLALVLIGAGIVVVRVKPRQRAASTDVVERTPARLERGRYLTENVLGCFDCHAKRDYTRFGAPVSGPLGGGGDCFGANERFPGTLCTSNISSDLETGIGAWTDGEIKRAIREGVGRDGQALFPIMPYREYSRLSEEDTSAVITYLRSQPAVKNPVPRSNIDFPVKYLIKLAPEPLKGPVAEPGTERVAQGAYLARVSGCIACHTPVDQRHLPLAGQELSGGQEFAGPFGTVRSSNLTPHATGLGNRDEAAFVGMFKAFDVAPDSLPQIKPQDGTLMPWLSRAKMTTADLGAIYAYLKTVPPIDRTVEKRPRPAALAQPSGAAAPKQ
jgi:mono/diheme cytochrome c family protein